MMVRSLHHACPQHASHMLTPCMLHTGARLKEASSINQSLLVLGRVFKALVAAGRVQAQGTAHQVWCVCVGGGGGGG